MPAIRTEPRTAMMALVELSWEDQFGTRHSSSAKLEDTSPSGACVRVRVPVAIGSIMKVNSYRERFSGIARYCRTERRDFVVGIQKDKNTSRLSAGVIAPNLQSTVPPQPAAPPSEPQKSNRTASPRVMTPIAVMPSRDEVHDPLHGVATQSPQFENQKEGNAMLNKWSDLAPWRQKQNGNEHDAAVGRTQAASSSSNHIAEVSARGDQSKLNPVAHTETPVPTSPTSGSPGDLLSMDDIYRAAGILAPRMGYSICKVADMLANDHLRGLSGEMKRASVLMALDAAGIPVDDVLRDAAMRQSAINNYESDQWEHFEEYWAAKAAENSHIQSELERITAQHQERIKRNLGEIAREKVIFAAWQTMKQQESQRIAEAAGICSKASIEEAFEEPQSAPRTFAATAKPA
jgi:hypothetical protein